MAWWRRVPAKARRILELTWPHKHPPAKVWPGDRWPVQVDIYFDYICRYYQRDRIRCPALWVKIYWNDGYWNSPPKQYSGRNMDKVDELVAELRDLGYHYRQIPKDDGFGGTYIISLEHLLRYEIRKGVPHIR